MRLKTFTVLLILTLVTITAVDATDSNTVGLSRHYSKKAPIGEYIKIPFRYYDYLKTLNRYNLKVPDPINVESFIRNLYKNAGNADKLSYAATQYAVDLYNEGYRVNHTGNFQWLNETSYRIFDFPGFKNLDSSHNDMWGLRVRLFNVEIENDTSTYNSTTGGTLKNDTSKNTQGIREENKTHIHMKNKNLTESRKTLVNEKIGIRQTGNPADTPLILICVIICILGTISLKRNLK